MGKLVVVKLKDAVDPSLNEGESAKRIYVGLTTAIDVSFMTIEAVSP